MTRQEQVEPEALRTLALELSRHWAGGPIAFVRNFSNAVYRLVTPAGAPALYLHLTPETHRSAAQIESELALIRHAAAESVPVSEPVRSQSGAFVHAGLVGETRWFACAFNEAPGVSYAEERPPDEAAFFHEAGRAMGRLHRALSTFALPTGFARFHWTEDRWSRFAACVPEAEVEAWGIYRELRDWTAQLDTEPPSFGLIHGDFTVANFRTLDRRITVFDFDSSCAHWRAYEIATFLHYFGARDEADRALAWNNVIRGYEEEEPLPDTILADVPRFAQMRLLYSYPVFAEEWGFERLTPEQEAYFERRRLLFRSAPVWPGTRTA